LATSALQRLQGRLIVSCQAAEGDPLDDVNALTRIAASVLQGGAGGLRAEGASHVAAFRAITDLPIIGIVKTYDNDQTLCITPDLKSAETVSEAGADIVALDCTSYRSAGAEPWPELVFRIQRELAVPVLADIATLEDALAVEQAGVDAVATTLFGYTPATAGLRYVSWPLVEELVSRLRIPVLVEGHITRPEEVEKAMRMGVHAVVVGSAITRPQTITARFVQALRR
jgi:N-acylglucosamine-6-phosphate 2-epimerase